MNLQIQKSLGSLIKKLPSGLPSINGNSKLPPGITMTPAKIRKPKIVGGTLQKPRIRIRIMQNALRNQLGRSK